MTWTPNGSFSALLSARQREELFAVEISGHATVFTTGPVASPSWTYLQTLAEVEVEAGQTDVARGRWQLGALSFVLEDRSGSAAAVASIADLGGRTVTLWMGFRGLGQSSWEKIGTYTIEDAEIEEYGRIRFSCIEPFPELGRALATSLGSGVRKTVESPVSVGQARVYVDDREDLEIGQTVILYDANRYTIGTVDALGTDYVAGTPNPYVDLAAAVDQFIGVNGTLARCLSIKGNPVNLAVRILVDDFATVGSIQTDFPIDAAFGSWTAGDGFGVPLSRLDVAAIKAERDARMSTLLGQVVFEKRDDNGREWLNALCHGVMQLVIRRNGLLSIRSCLLPSSAGSPASIDETSGSAWGWRRNFADAYNRVIVEGDVLGGSGRQLAVVEDSASIAAIGRRELVVSSPWIRRSLSGEQNASIIGGRILARTTSGAETLTLVASVGKSVVEAGDSVLLTNPKLPDTGAGGAAMSGAIAEIAEASLSLADNGVSVVARRYPFARGAAIAPNSQADYGSATSNEKASYAFITQDDGKMPDGTSGYTWV